MSKHVAVLMGGWSAEREVSLWSGEACAKAAESVGYRVTRVDVGRDVAQVLDALRPDVALNVLHDSFFLSEYKVLNLFICGIGTVGGKLIDAKGVSRLYRPRISTWQLWLLAMAGLIALFVSLAVTPVGQTIFGLSAAWWEDVLQFFQDLF